MGSAQGAGRGGRRFADALISHPRKATSAAKPRCGKEQELQKLADSLGARQEYC